jgi:hypothetical protein
MKALIAAHHGDWISSSSARKALARAVRRLAQFADLAEEPGERVDRDVEGLDRDVADLPGEVPDHRGNTTARASAPM